MQTPSNGTGSARKRLGWKRTAPIPAEVRTIAILLLAVFFSLPRMATLRGGTDPGASGRNQTPGLLLDPIALEPGGNLDVSVITHGPLVYGVTDTSAVVFYRTLSSSFLAVEYSTQPDLSMSTLTDSVLTLAEDDFVAHVPLSNLTPLTTYYYAPHLQGRRVESAEYASFRTFPQESDSTVVSFAIVADASNVSTDSATCYEDINALDPAFVVQLGDFDHRDPASCSNPPDIRDWRTMHKDVIRDSVAGQMFSEFIGRSFPVTKMWDDHDYGRNNADKNAPWKALATKAFREYFPNYPPANPGAGNWYSFRCGQSEFFVLDLRSQRDFNLDIDDANKSMLDGDNIVDGQKDWLLRGLLKSTATWKIILSTVPFNPTVLKLDAWSNFLTERAEIVDFIQTNQIENVILISGDIHTGGAIDDGTYSNIPELSVPHANFPRVFPSGCAAEDCGAWSEGLYDGGDSTGGFAWVSVSTDGVMLQTSYHRGLKQVTYVVWNVQRGRGAAGGWGATP